MGVTHLSKRTLQGDDRIAYSRQYDLFGTDTRFSVGIGTFDDGGRQRVGPVNTEDNSGEVFHIHRQNQVVRLKYPAYWKVMQYGNIGAEQDIAHSLAITVVNLDTSDTVTYTQDRTDNFFTEIVTPDDSSEAQTEADEIIQGLLTHGGSTVSGDGSEFDVNNFNPNVATRLKINTWNLPGYGKRHAIIVHYQACAIDQIAENGLDIVGGDLRYSPSLMKNLLERIIALENSNRYTNKFGVASNSQDILEEDLSGTGAENYVLYEKHDFNIVSGVNVIQPIKGAFYGHDVEVIIPVYNRITLTPAEVERLRELISTGKTILLSYSDTEAVLDATSHVSKMNNLVLTTTWLDNYLEKIEGKEYSQYYSGSYVIVNGDSTAVERLTEGEDFVIEAIDIPRTARVENADYVVYRHIRLLNSRIISEHGSGEVLISYHAFGGEPTIDVIRSMRQDIENTRDILRESSLITTTSLDQQATIINLGRRISRMEEYHSHYNQVEHRVSIGHAGWHWFNIATIYNGNWNLPTSGIRDVGHFRIQSLLRDWVYEFFVDVDMTRDDADKIHLKVVGSNQSSGYDIVNFKRLMLRDHVAIRLCWMCDSTRGEPDLNAGIVLQMGWNFDHYADTDFKVDTDSIIVTNKSGSASSWVLLQDPHQINYQAKGLVDVYNHRNLERATTTNIVRDVSEYVFYKFQDKYVYTKTSDFYIKDGKKYFTYGYDVTTGRYTYTDISTYDVASHPEYSVGSPTSSVELYERRMWGRFPVQYTERTVSFAMIGSGVTVIPPGSEYYIYDDAARAYVALDTNSSLFGGVVTVETVGSNTRRGVVIPTLANAPSSSSWNKGKFRTVFKATVREQYYPSNGLEAIAAGDFYIVSDDSYSEDTMFKMPNVSEYWSSSDSVRCKSCIRILEPENGLVAWLGNVAIAQFAPSYAEFCTLCDGKDYNNSAKLTSGSGSSTEKTLTLNGYTTPFGLECTLQKFINTKYIKRMTVVVFDRRNGRYLVLENPVSVSSSTVNSTIEKQPDEVYCDFVLDTEDLCTLTVAVHKYRLTKVGDDDTIVKVQSPTPDKCDYYGRMIMRNPTFRMPSDGNAYMESDKAYCNSLYGTGGPNDTTEIFFATIHTNLGTNSLLVDSRGRFDLRQIRIHL